MTDYKAHYGCFSLLTTSIDFSNRFSTHENPDGMTDYKVHL